MPTLCLKVIGYSAMKAVPTFIYYCLDFFFNRQILLLACRA
jgi:hypothetical protein